MNRLYKWSRKFPASGVKVPHPVNKKFFHLMPGIDLHTLFIEKLVSGGFGLGRLETGIIVLVRYVLPGEKVVVRTVGRKKDYISAVPREILLPSSERIAAPCKYYGRCGGCDLQHARPAAQIRLKKEILADSLHRTGETLFSDPAFSIEDPLAAPKQFGYRQRIRLQVDSRGRYGFFRPESHVLEPISSCLLAEARLNQVLRQLPGSAFFNGLVRHCNAFELLFNPEQNNVVMLLHFLRKPRPADCVHARDLTHGVSNLAAVLMRVEGYGLYDPLAQTFLKSPPTLGDTVPIPAVGHDLTFTWEAGGFCQVNRAQNVNLIKLIMEITGSGPHSRVLDLYCGCGNFSLAVAGLGSEVVGIDGQNAAIRSAKRNALLNSVHSCRFFKNQIPHAVASLVAAGNIFETIILDPPRQGAPEIVARLPKLNPERIIYVSCNPATLARDLTSLIPAGYRLSRLVPVDMFPQTHHLECVALLKREDLES